ncbi:MAG: ABC transporter ATP-binding protein [Nitrospirae bacterium]|nr:ABC transporter ATP-binding protein [Nitrospirota bacterium]
MKNTEHRTQNTDFIRCEGVWKIYNEGKPYEVKALSDVSLTIDRGSFVIFNGPSGSGKTTIISILGTMDRPSRGKAFLSGNDITRLSDVALSELRKKSIGFVFQNFNLISGLSAWENVSISLVPQGINEKERRQRAEALLGKLGLLKRAGHSPEELSGGEQQRVAIARALINNPEILILDEPTSNIDLDAVHTLIETLKTLKAEGRTIIVSTHDNILFSSADKVFELKRGQLSL